MRFSRKLNRFGRRKVLPPLFFFTDPVRVPDPAAVIARLPRGCAVVFRAFGADNAVNHGQDLARLARARGLLFLVGSDEALAAACRADGIHLPQRQISRARVIRARHPRWIVTAAAHSSMALARAGKAKVDAAFLSPVFTSRSRSAGRPLGSSRFCAWATKAGVPVFALGGMNAFTARRASRMGASGIAAIGSFVRT